MASGTRKRFSGVRRDQRVRIDARRDDTRTFRRRLGDTTSKTSGTVAIFGGFATLSLLLSWAPFVPELLFALALGVFATNYRFAHKRWSIPFRVPRYLGSLIRTPVLDATTGKPAAGNIFLGRCEETGEEVWANTSDLNKHSLLIGTTGSGKTEAIMGQLFGFVALNSGGMVVDGKASVTTFGSAYKIARLFGRDADLLTMDYLTGGIDVAGLQKERRSHTYNPLAFGGPAQKSETMVSLLDGGDPMWSGRAMTFVENVIPPLSYLSDRGYIVLNPKRLGVFSVLEVIENLILFGLFRDMHGKLIFLTRETSLVGDWAELQTRSGGIHTYLEGLPGYGAGRPPKPHRLPDMTDEEWRDIDAAFSPQGPPIDPAARVEVSKQHGFIQMQLTRSITNLSENYGFIYGAERGEIDFRDMVLNRRLMVVLLPALERSPENLKQLGKMTTLSLKAVLGSMLNTAAEGARREIIDGNPAAARTPFLVVLDEVGSYKSPGLAVIPAQARSLGISVCFGTQSIADLMKGDEKDRTVQEAEGKAILDNTAVKFFGRLTSDEKSDTARTAISMGGDVHVQVADQASFHRSATGLPGGLQLASSSGLQTHAQIAYDDLARQQDGEFHVIVGSHDTDERGYASGGARVIRALAFYTGGLRDVEDWRRNPFASVKPPSKADLKRLREAEIAARQMRDGMRAVLDRPSARLLGLVRRSETDTYIGAFLAHRRMAQGRGEWPRGREDRARAVRDWVAARAEEDRLRRALAETRDAHASWLDELSRDVRTLDLDPLVTQATARMAAPWHALALAALTGGRSPVARPAAGLAMDGTSATAIEGAIEVVVARAAGGAGAAEGGREEAPAPAPPAMEAHAPTAPGASKDLIVVAPFGTHAFADANHVRNFLRYLFSLTRDHPTRTETALNLVTEWEEVEGRSVCIAAYRNTDPKALHESYRHRRLAEIANPDLFMDDGAYLSFVVSIEGEAFSNLVTARRRAGGALEMTVQEGSRYGAVLQTLGGWGAFEPAVARAARGAETIRTLKDANPAQREAIERRLHEAANEAMGGRAALVVTHADQLTHNPHHHIHRIRRWEPGERPTITHEEIGERNRTTTPYDGDRLPVQAAE